MTTTQTYNNHTITLTDDWRFRVDGPALDDSDVNRRIYDSMEQAKTRIDERAKQHERQVRDKLSIPMLDENGRDVTITGVHGGHYALLGVKGASTIYPPLPAVRALLVEQAGLRKRQKKIFDLLSGCGVRMSGPYAVRTYDDAIAKHRQNIEAASAAAAKLDLPG